MMLGEFQMRLRLALSHSAKLRAPAEGHEQSPNEESEKDTMGSGSQPQLDPMNRPTDPAAAPAAAAATAAAAAAAANDAFLITDGVGKILRATPSASYMLNVPIGRLAGKPITTFVPLTSRRHFRAEMSSLANEIRAEWSTWLFRRDGDPVEVKVIAVSARDDAGRVSEIHWEIRNNSERRRTQQQLIRYEQRLRALATALAQAEERERRRIAHGLHDSVGQMLALLKLKLGVLRQAPPSDKTGRQLSEIESVLDDAIHETRALTFELAPPILYELGLVPALQWLAERYDGHGNLRVRLHVAENGDARPPAPTPEIAALLFTAVRELLHNVVKHAKASAIDVSVRDEKGRLCIAVDDDGSGFDLEADGDGQAGNRTATSEANQEHKTDGFGLFSIRTRLLYVGGEMRVSSAQGKGTHVTLIAPPDRVGGHEEG